MTDDELAAWLSEAVARTGVPGASLAVLRHGELFAAQAGVLSVETGESVTADAVFQVGSTTKVMTAAIVLQLVDEGALALDTTIGEVLGALAWNDPTSAAVTVRQLLDHTSGLPGNHFADFGPGADSIGRYVGSLADLAPIHPAGAMFSYSNGGYVVAGRIAEVVTGRTYAELVDERVADHLALRTVTTRPGATGGPVALGHEPDGDGRQRVATIQTAAWSSTPAGSQMTATVADLAAFGRAAIGRPAGARPSLLSAGGQRLLLDASVELPCPYWGSRAQCLGWGLDVRGGRTVVLHGGGTTGHSALLMALPELDVVTAVAVNSVAGVALLVEAETAIFGDRFGVPGPLAAPPAEHRLTAAEAAALVGTYSDHWATTTIRLAGDELVAERQIAATTLNAAYRFDPVPLAAIGPRLVTAGGGRPMLFLGDDPADPTAPVTLLHQRTAARRIA